MPRVGLLFEVRYAETQMGETICVVGDQPALGEWAPSASASCCEALELRTSSLVYPRWTMRAPVWLRWEGTGGSGKSVEYKFVKARGNNRSIRWEDKIANRRIVVPEEDGGIFLVSDARWESTLEPATVSRMPLTEISKRWATLDPEGARHRVRSASAWAGGREAGRAAPPSAGFQLSPAQARQEAGGHKRAGLDDEMRSPHFGKAPQGGGKARDGDDDPRREQACLPSSQPLPFILRRPGNSRSRGAGFSRQRSSGNETMKELERLQHENRKLREASVEMLRLRLENGALRRSLGMNGPTSPMAAGGQDACHGPAFQMCPQDALGPKHHNNMAPHPSLAQPFCQDALGPPRCTLAPDFPHVGAAYSPSPSASPGGLVTPSAHKTSGESADTEESQTQSPVIQAGTSSSSYAAETPEGEPGMDSPSRGVRPFMAWTSRGPDSSSCYAGLYGKIAWAEKVLREPQEEPSAP